MHLRVLAVAAALFSSVSISARAEAPPPPCPPACALDQHHKCCGLHQSTPDGESSCSCPPAILFAAGIDNDMVLQRATSENGMAKAAVYGSVLQAGAEVEVSVVGSDGETYTVRAAVFPAAATFAGSGGANYTANWKALLKPAPAGGSLTITAKCTANCGTTDASRNTASITRVVRPSLRVRRLFGTSS